MQTNSAKKAVDFHKLVGDFRLSDTSGHRVSRMLLTGKEGAPNNYKMGLGGGGESEDWTTPRHRHTFEQFRYPLSGEYVIRKDEVLPAGWVAYFPESVYYGPQIKRGDLLMLSLQFGGPSGLGYWSAAERKKATERLLAKGGKFDDGVYTWTDDKGRRHNQDASEAVEAEARGHDVDYPEPRYKDLVMINPAAFSWIKDKDARGVARKNLGSFTERDARFGFVQMEKGATLQFGTERAPEVLYLKEGVLAHDNSTYDAQSAFGTEADEKPVSLTAVEPSELVYMKLPTF